MPQSHHNTHSSGHQGHHRHHRHRSRSGERRDAHQEVGDLRNKKQEKKQVAQPAEPAPWSDWRPGENGLWFYQGRQGPDGNWEYRFTSGYLTAKRPQAVYGSRGLSSYAPATADVQLFAPPTFPSVPMNAPVQHFWTGNIQTIQGVNPQMLGVPSSQAVAMIMPPSAEPSKLAQMDRQPSHPTDEKATKAKLKVDGWLNGTGEV